MRQARGFTLIEMLLSVSIIGLLAGFSLPVYQSFQNRNELDITAQGLASALRRAQTYARGMNGDSDWGVSIQTGSIILFKGSVFASRDTAYDEPVTISPNTIVSGGVSQVLFTKFSGAPTTTGTVTLTSINNDVRTVNINAKGMVTY